MDTKKLRQKILDLAIRGKLVPQDPNDEPASVLLERIRGEKERLIKEGKIKRSKKSASDDEIEAPFEIPESWEWCMVEDFTYDLQYGTSEKSSAEGEVPVLRMGNITRVGTVDFSDLVYSSNKDDINKYALIKDDLLFNRTNSSEWVGKTAIFKSDSPAIYAGYLIRVRCILVCPDFINFVLNSSYHRDWCNQVKTDAVNQSNINAQKLSKHLIPIPPYKEQLRIANVVERWFTLIDELESNEGDLLKAIDKAKSKILDLAIHGKLVPQDPNDEPAIDLLKRINPKFEACEITHEGDEIPENWCESLVGEYVETVTDYVASGSFASLRENVTYYKEPNYAILVKTQDFQNGFSDNLTYTDRHGYEFLQKSNLFGGELILSNVGSIGKLFIVPKLNKKMTLAPNAIMVRFHDESHIKWFYYLFSSKIGYNLLLSISSATAISKFNKTDFKKLIIPIPPIQEQIRIVAKIEELFAVLDNIKESLEY